MKKLLLIVTALFIAISVSACKKEEEGTFEKADGQYFAIAEEPANSYVYWTIVTIENKKITDVEWNGYHIDGGAVNCLGDNKYNCSKDGNYQMVERGGASAPWYEQVDDVTDYIVENQTIKADLTFDDHGVVDEISSVSIHSIELFDLIDEALAGEPVPEGDYTDGYYYFETDLTEKTVTYAKPVSEGSDQYETFEETFDTSTFATFLVVNGTIVLADFNARHDAYEYVMEDDSFATYVYGQDEEGDDLEAKIVDGTFNEDGDFVPTKKYLTKDSAGDWYGMSQRPNTVEWDEQVEYVEAKLLEDQSLSVTDNTFDDVSEATIHVDALIQLLNDFMADAE